MSSNPAIGLPNYRIGQLVYTAGRESIYTAEQLEPFREVVLQIVELPDSVGKDRLEEESRRWGELDHPNVLPLLDHGSSDDHFYRVYEDPQGGTLRERMDHAFELVEALRVASGLADGLGYLHRNDLVHRDLTPWHVFFDDQGAPRLCCAISGPWNTEGKRVDDGIELASPEHASPEALAGGELDARSDNYALGLLIFEMLTGKPLEPTAEDGSDETTKAHKLPESLVHFQPLLDGMLNPDPGKRFSVAGDLIKKLYRDMSEDSTERDDDLPPIPPNPKLPITRRLRSEDSDDESPATGSSPWVQALIWLGILALTAFLIAVITVGFNQYFDKF